MKYYSLIIFSLMLVACDSSSGPDGSWRVGEPGKAVYVFIEDNGNDKDRVYQGSIYSEKDESVIYKGTFDYSRHTPIDYQNPDIYASWDGERLYLLDNSFLKKTR